MELKQYIRIVGRRWWLAAIAMVVTLGLTMVFTSRQPPVYETQATFVVGPRLLANADVARLTETLIRGPEINSTFAAIANSDSIQDAATARVGADIAAGKELNVATDVQAGTNILRITVTGTNAEVVTDFASAVASETVAYIERLNHVFSLAPLDPPEMPTSPSGPNKPLTNILGGILGVMLGAFLAFAAEYLSEPAPETVAFNILDPLSGVGNEAYFKVRFDQEMSRAHHTGQVFTLAMIQAVPSSFSNGVDRIDPAEIAHLLEPMVRPEDVLAHVSDLTFGLIMPALTEGDAEKVLANWASATWPATDGVPPPGSPFTMSVGVCEYGREDPPAAIRGI